MILPWRHLQDQLSELRNWRQSAGIRTSFRRFRRSTVTGQHTSMWEFSPWFLDKWSSYSGFFSDTFTFTHDFSYHWGDRLGPLNGVPRFDGYRWGHITRTGGECSRATQQASHRGQLCLAEFSQARASHHVSPVNWELCLFDPFGSHITIYQYIYISYIYILQI